MRKKLIINADDFGMSHDFNVAICDLLEKRCISSTSLMPNGCAYKEAIDMIHSKHLRNIGVHITLTRENFDCAGKLAYKSLTHGSSIEDKDGFLLLTPSDLAKLAKDDDIIQEIQNQILTIIKDGVDIAHVDNHMYSLMPRIGRRGYKLFFNAYKLLGIKRKLGIRIASSWYFFPDINYVYAGRKIQPYLWWEMLRNHLKGVQYSFAFPYYAPNHKTLESKKQLLHLFLSSVKEGRTELHFHPAVYSKELERQNPFWYNRVQEYELLRELSPEMLANRYGIELIAY